MAKVMRLRGPTGKGESGLKGALLDFLEHLSPKPESACCTALCFLLTLLTLTGAVPAPPPNLFLEKVNLELLDNKSPGHNECFNPKTPLIAF